MASDWVPWVAALLPGMVTLLAAVYSFDAVPALGAGAKRSWSDIPTVEAVQDLSLHAVFYAPLWVGLMTGVFFDHSKLQGLARYLFSAVTVVTVFGFFALGRGCIAKVRQLERIEELAARKHEEELLVAAHRP